MGERRDSGQALPAGSCACERAYPLVIWLPGRPVPDNRLKERFTLEIDGRRIIQTRSKGSVSDPSQQW
jgi:hypothetical protein